MWFHVQMESINMLLSAKLVTETWWSKRLSALHWLSRMGASEVMSTILFSKVCKKALIEFMVVVSSVILFFFFFWVLDIKWPAKQAFFQIGLKGNKCNGMHCMSNTSKTFSIIIDGSELDDEVINCSFSIYTP